MVGMSKSGSRYGRRSNWFKIHCLLQEQQQQAAAAMAAHQNNQQQGHNSPAGLHAKPPGIPPPAAAAAALGMLGHAGAYPGLYPPRTKEELMMLSLEEYAKHPAAASPSVSSPDSHNSDSSLEINGRPNINLMHLANKHGSLEANAAASSSSVGPPPPPHPAHLRKDLPPFLPLPFPALSSMPVMPPPSFLPPSHLLFPGYHPALYQHAHAGLLKPSPEQQAAAAAVHQLFNNAPRFHPTTITNSVSEEHKAEEHKQTESSLLTPRSDALNNNHIPNGSKAAEELKKRFYLDAVLKSQQQSPPPMVTKIPNLTKHDHSISALVTPNSESGRNHNNTSRQSNEEEGDEEDREHHNKSLNDTHSNGHDSEHHEQEEEEEDLVVSMTPPRSPIDVEDDHISKTVNHDSSPQRGQDNPIDLSMKTVSSVSSCLSNSNRCDSSSDQENYVNDTNENSEEGDRENTENCLNNNNNENEEEIRDKQTGLKRTFEESFAQHSSDEVEIIPAKMIKREISVLDLTGKQ